VPYVCYIIIVERLSKEVGVPNTIRNPKQGKTERSRQIASAVDDQGWQEFRISLKGLTTREKLRKLKSYLASGPGGRDTRKVRVDNYLKALARGGQVTLKGEFRSDFSHVTIKKEK
jgi:hypothetical protein